MSQFQDNVRKNIEENIFPLVVKLKRRAGTLDRRYLTLLEQHLKDLTGEFPLKLMERKWRLSSREMEVCKMLKNGLKTKDIAELLCTSVRTVEHHRNHIRKKLGISKSSVDLCVYLKDFVF